MSDNHNNITSESIIQDAMFALGMNTNLFTGANKDSYLRSFRMIRRLLIGDKKLAATLILDQKLNTVLDPEHMKFLQDEKDWYFQPYDLCQFFYNSVPKEICMLPRVPDPSNVVEKTKAIKMPGGSVSYYADTEFYETLPSAFVALLSWKMKEMLALQMSEVKGGLLTYIMQKIKETETELNKAKASEQNTKGSPTNIKVRKFSDIAIAT